MKLKELKSCIDQAFGKTEDGNVDVEVYIIGDEDRVFEVERVGQFSFVPDVTIGVKEL